MRTKPSEQRGAFTKTAAEFFFFFSTDINECRISVATLPDSASCIKHLIVMTCTYQKSCSADTSYCSACIICRGGGNAFHSYKI